MTVLCFFIEDAVSLRYVEGPTPGALESSGSCSANVSTWTATTRVGSKEAEAGSTAGNCDGPRRREVVPRAAPAMPDDSTSLRRRSQIYRGWKE